jgi:RNase H-fold protein (predicted Holliday junction resolvase)
MKQYRGGPSGGINNTKNQNAFFQMELLSKPKKKYSIATIVVAAPTTPRNTNALRTGREPDGIGMCIRTAHKMRKSIRESAAEMR